MVKMTPSFLGITSGVSSVSDVWNGYHLGNFHPDMELTIRVPPMGVRLLRSLVNKNKCCELTYYDFI